MKHAVLLCLALLARQASARQIPSDLSGVRGLVLEDPDRERWVARAVTNGRDWLAQPNPDWQEGLKQAEIEANLLEAAQLVPMREPPTRTVNLLHTAPPNVPALQAIVRGYVSILEPYQKNSQQAAAVK